MLLNLEDDKIMNDSKKKFLEKASTMFWSVAEASVDSVRRQALSNSKNKQLSEEYRQKWADIADNYDNIKNRIHDYRERDKDDELYEDYLDCYESLDDTDIPSTGCFQEEHHITKEYINPHKAGIQEVSARIRNISNQEISTIQEDSWVFFGKLKDIDCENQTIDGVGIIRFTVAGEIVYLCRAIELNNGGIVKRIMELKNLKINKKTKLYSEIAQNINFISVDVLYLGNDMQAVDVCRNVEKILIQKYNPKWMER